MGAGHLTTEVVVWGQGGGLTLACVVAGGPSVSGLLAPPKFSLPHRAVCFGAGGQLVLVCPHSPAEGQRPLVKLHSLEVRPSSQIHPWFRHWSCPFHPNVRHHSSPKWPPQQPSRPPATISSPALMASWASWCQPLPGHHSHPLDPISCSFGSTTLMLSMACSQRSPSVGVDVVHTPLRGKSAYLSEVLLYGGHTHPLSPPQHFSLLSCLPEEAAAISRTILAMVPHMMV